MNIQRRPFGSLAEMNETIVKDWNETVGADDEVWHLGNFTRRAGDVEALLAGLDGRKHLVRGNNDLPGSCSAKGWTTVQDYAESPPTKRF